MWARFIQYVYRFCPGNVPVTEDIFSEQISAPNTLKSDTENTQMQCRRMLLLQRNPRHRDTVHTEEPQETLLRPAALHALLGQQVSQFRVGFGQKGIRNGFTLYPGLWSKKQTFQDRKDFELRQQFGAGSRRNGWRQQGHSIIIDKALSSIP